MPSRPEDLYLADIIEACHDVRSFVGGGPMRSRYPGVPWREIVGFRNVAVHEYFAVEWNVVWRIAVFRLPELVDQALAILRAEYPDTAVRLTERLERGE